MGANGHVEASRSKPVTSPKNEQAPAMAVKKFDQDEFDSYFYSQEGASDPPTGVVPKTRTREPASPAVEDRRLYLPVDPRIHWPRDWSEEWYSEKMEEIKARGNRKDNWGKVLKRMRAQRIRAEALAAKEKKDMAADAPLQRQREPLPRTHRRHADFGDISEERLPWLVRTNPAWLRACAWMRANRGKEAQREQEIRRVKAHGGSMQHVIGRTGW